MPWHEERHAFELEREWPAGKVEVAGAEEGFEVGLEEEPEPLLHPHHVPRGGDPRPRRTVRPSHRRLRAGGRLGGGRPGRGRKGNRRGDGAGKAVARHLRHGVEETDRRYGRGRSCQREAEDARPRRCIDPPCRQEGHRRQAQLRAPQGVAAEAGRSGSLDLLRHDCSPRVAHRSSSLKQQPQAAASAGGHAFGPAGRLSAAGPRRSQPGSARTVRRDRRRQPGP